MTNKCKKVGTVPLSVKKVGTAPCRKCGYHHDSISIFVNLKPFVSRKLAFMQEELARNNTPKTSVLIFNILIDRIYIISNS